MRYKHRKYDDCKGTRRHSWFLAEVDKKSTFGTPTWHRCELCDTVRITIVDVHGNVASRYYQYPRDYREYKLTSASYRLMEISKFRSEKRKK
jgi:hypothetical protein